MSRWKKLDAHINPNDITVRELRSCWDGRPWQSSGPKCGGCCAPFPGGSWVSI